MMTWVISGSMQKKGPMIIKSQNYKKIIKNERVITLGNFKIQTATPLISG